MLIKTNSLVLYKSKAALVIDINNDKYTIRTHAGDNKSVRLKDIEIVHPGPCQTIPALLEIPDNDSLREYAELIGSDTMPFADFTELLFGAFTPAAALTALEILSQNCYFTGSAAAGAAANSDEHIQAVLEKENQKIAQQQARAALLERIRTGQVTPEDRSSLREIENVAYNESSSSKLMHELNMEPLPEKAQNLLLKLNVWNEFDNNPWPRRFEVDLAPEYPELPPLPEEERTDLTYMPAYAIDDADSTDPDDAISFDPSENLLWVHVADPSAVVTSGSELENAARCTGCTSYLPEKITTMLPPESVAMFGLGLAETSPALSFGIAIDNNGNTELKKLTLSTVKVTRMNYSEAEDLISSGSFEKCAAALERFRQMRAANNAVMIRLPEVKIKVNIAEREIVIRDLERSPARELVANAMMAAGNAVAKFAAAKDIALPFAVQSDPEMTERPDTVPGMYELRKSCRISTLSTLPGKHAGLGLEPYVRVTSPLRRYEDLLSHIQLRKYLKGETLLTMTEVDERIADSEPNAVLRGKLERQCREYWTLVYLKNRPEHWQTEAIFVSKPDDRSVWLLPKLAFEFKNRYNARIPLGETVQVECTACEPALLSVQFRIVKNASVEESTE